MCGLDNETVPIKMDTKALAATYTAIDTYVEKLDTHAPGAVSDSAKQIYTRALQSSLFNNEKQSLMFAGSIFVACRQNDCLRGAGEISRLENANYEDVVRISKRLEDFLDRLNTNATRGNANTTKVSHAAPSTTPKAGNWHSRHAAQPGTIADKGFAPVRNFVSPTLSKGKEAKPTTSKLEPEAGWLDVGEFMEQDLKEGYDVVTKRELKRDLEQGYVKVHRNPEKCE